MVTEITFQLPSCKKCPKFPNIEKDIITNKTSFFYRKLFIIPNNNYCMKIERSASSAARKFKNLMSVVINLIEKIKRGSRQCRKIERRFFNYFIYMRSYKSYHLILRHEKRKHKHLIFFTLKSINNFYM